MPSQMARGNMRVSNSTDSTISDRFYSAQTSIDDAEMLDTSAVRFPISPVHSNIPIDSFHDLLHSDGISWPPTSPDYKLIDPLLTGRLSDSSSLTTPDSKLSGHDQLIAKAWIFPPDIPINVVKYAIGRRELAMQTHIDPPFDLIESDPYTHPSLHTPQTEKLKAWYKIVTRPPRCLPSKHDEPQWPHVRLAFGPLGWDQIWGYEYVDLKKVSHNAGYKDWWLRDSENHRNWCAMHYHVEVYGVEVKFPYGHDIRLPTSSTITTEDTVRIPANERVIIPLGKDLTEWANQVLFQHEHWDDGPPFPYPFNPYDRLQEPPTITLRFRNKHPDASTMTTSAADKGRWTNGWLTTDELTILSSEVDSTYLDTVIDGGPKADPDRDPQANRAAKLQFWDLLAKREDVVEWMARADWMRERFRVDRNDSQGEEALRRLVREKVHESALKAIRSTPL